MIASGYLIQAALIIAWWIGMISSDPFSSLFLYPGIDKQGYFGFLLPDILLISILSLIRGYVVSRDLQLIILGGFSYATLWCVNIHAGGNGNPLPTMLMVAATLYNLFLCYGEHLFRTSRSAGFTTNALKTLIQIVCTWSIFLGAIPFAIMSAFHQSLSADWYRVGTGIILFAGFSALGLYSSFIMVRHGGGTPLPLDQTNHLVITGPYGIVRNPMAVAGIGQGISIAIACASIPLLVYAIVGSVLWQVVVRPMEERDLEQRFGESYKVYRSKVDCWIPRILRWG